LPIRELKDFRFVQTARGKQDFGAITYETGMMEQLPVAPSRRREEIELLAPCVLSGIYGVKQ
jgi:hypothetical protein